MSCINTNSKEFKSLLDKVDISSATLELIIHKIQNTKNNAKYPSVSEINEILRPQSFEGSETIIEIWNKQYSSPINFPTIALAREEFNKASRIFGKNSVSIIEKKNGTYDLVVGNPSPNQIKSATDNVGTFSRTNDRIDYFEDASTGISYNGESKDFLQNTINKKIQAIENKVENISNVLSLMEIAKRDYESLPLERKVGALRRKVKAFNREYNTNIRVDDNGNIIHNLNKLESILMNLKNPKLADTIIKEWHKEQASARQESINKELKLLEREDYFHSEEAKKENEHSLEVLKNEVGITLDNSLIDEFLSKVRPSNPYHQLFKQVVDILRNNNIPINIVIDSTLENIAARKQDGFKTATIRFNPSLLLGYLMTDDRVSAKGNVMKILTHELIHALTAEILETHPTWAKIRGFDKAQTEFTTKTWNLYLQCKEQLKGTKWYGLKNAKEFIAVALTDRDFQVALSKIKVREKSAFKRFINYITDLFNKVFEAQGINIKDSVLEEVISISQEYFDYANKGINKGIDDYLNTSDYYEGEKSFEEYTEYTAPINETTDEKILNGKLAFTREGNIVVSRNVNKEDVFKYIKGEIDSPTSKQKKVVFDSLAKKGYTEAKLRELIQTDEDAKKLLTYHELSHKYWEDSSKDYYEGDERNSDGTLVSEKINWLSPNKLEVEKRATLDAIQRIELEKGIANTKRNTKQSSQTTQFTLEDFEVKVPDGREVSGGTIGIANGKYVSFHTIEGAFQAAKLNYLDNVNYTKEEFKKVIEEGKDSNTILKKLGEARTTQEVTNIVNEVQLDKGLNTELWNKAAPIIRKALEDKYEKKSLSSQATNQQTTQFTWNRTSDNSYEVSSKGDKRFSALVATFKKGTVIDGVDVGGMTIEDVYQKVIKKSGKGQAPAQTSRLNLNPTNVSEEKREVRKREVIEAYGNPVSYKTSKGIITVTFENGELEIIPFAGSIRDSKGTSLGNNDIKYFVGALKVVEDLAGGKEDFSYTEGYLPLWQEWARQNPELMDELRAKSAGKTLTDQFANTRVSQARALADILNSQRVKEPTEKTIEDIQEEASQTDKTEKEQDLYTTKQQEKMQQIDNLLGDNLLSATEVRHIAEQAVYWISDHITELQENPELAKTIYGDRFKNEDGTDKDFASMTRADVVRTIGVDNIVEMCKQKFSPEHNDFDNDDTLDKAFAITDNWQAIMLLAQDSFLNLENFSIVSTPDGKANEVNEDLVGDADNFNESNDQSDVEEIEGNLQEHWQIESRCQDVLGTMSQMVRRALLKCYILDKDGNNVQSEFGINERINVREATNSILRWTQGSLSLADMITKLQDKQEDNPWVKQLINRLSDTSGKETDFQGQFYGTFSKHFQSYSVVIEEDGKYKSIQVNENPALSEAMTQITTQYKIGEHPLFTTDGINKESFKELRAAYDSLEKFRHMGYDLSKEVNKDEAANTLGYISNLFGYYVTPDMVKSNLTSETFKKMYSALGYMIKSFENNLDNASYEPFKFKAKDSINGNMREFLKPITEQLEDIAVSAFYDSGKMYQSYVTPSYMSKLMQKFSQKGEAFDKFLTEEFGNQPWFHEGTDIERGWRNSWLRALATDSKAREIFKHKVQLNFNKHNYMRDMSDMEYILSLFTEYFSESANDKQSRVPAWFRVPMLSNKPSSEFIRFYSERGTNYKETITDGMMDIFNQELSRIQTVLMRNLDSKDPRFIKNFDKNGKKFCFLDFMNDYLTGDKKNSELGKLINDKVNGKEVDEAKLYELANKAIFDTMDARAKAIVEKWVDSGLMEGAKKITDIGVTEEEIKSNLENFVWNDTFAAMNIMELTVTDIAYYKNAEDLQKRLAQIHAPGIRGNIEATDYEGRKVSDGKERTFYLTDWDSFISNIIDNVSIVFDRKIAEAPEAEKAGYRALKESLVGENGAFRNINVADAQGYSSPTSYRKKAFIFGKWSKKAEDIYQKLRKGDYNYSDLSVAFQPLKPFVYSQIEKSSGVAKAPLDKFKVPVQNKNSEYLLIMADAILQNENTGRPNLLRAIYEVMEESHYDEDGNYKTDGIDTVQFESTVKSGLMGRINLNKYVNDANGEAKAKAVIEACIYETTPKTVQKVNPETRELEDVTVNIKTGKYSQTYVHELPFEDYCLQQEVPEHFKNHEQVHGSQLRYIVVSELATKDSFGNDATYEVEGRKVSADEFKAEYEQTIADNIEDSISELESALGLNSTSTKDRNIALSKILQREILSSPRYGVDLLQACSVDENGRFRIPLGDPIQSKRVEQLINSIIKNRVNKQEIAGGPVVQVTNFGTSRELNIRFKDKNGGLLKTRAEYEKNPIKKELSQTDKFNAKYKGLNTSESTMSYEDYIKENQGGIAYFEVFAPIYTNNLFSQFADKNGNISIEALEALDPDLLKMIGYRIPTEAKYSMAPLKIVGFLPREAGDGIMLPNDITLLTGSDFDVDKEYLMRKDYGISRNKITKSALHKILYDSLIESQKGELSYGVKSKLNSLVRQFLEDPFDKASLVNQKTADGFMSIPSSSYNKLLKLYLQNAFTVEKPTEGRIYRNNKIVDMTYEVLTHETSCAEMLNPGGFDPQKRMGYLVTALRTTNKSYEELSKMSIDELKDLSNKDKNLMFVDTHVQFYKQNSAAGSLIGIFAVNRIAHAVIENEGYMINVDNACRLTRPFTVADMTFGGNMPIDVRFDNNGQSVGKVLGSLVASAADAVKDPVLNLMNINSNTANILNTLIRLGMPFDDAALFLSQRAISSALNQFSSKNITGFTSLSKVVDDRIKRIEKDLNIDENSSLNEEELTREQLIEGVKSSDPRIEYKVLKAFRNFQRLADAMRMPTFATRFNSISSAVGPLIIDNLITEHKMEKLSSESNILGSDGEEISINDIFLAHPILNQFRRTLGIAQSLFGNMPANSTGFRNILTYASENPIGDAILSDRKVLSSLSDFYQSYLVVAGNVVNSSNLGKVISEFPKEFMEKNYKKQYNDNLLIQSIKYGTDKGGRATLQIDITGLDTQQKERLSSAWIDLHKVNPELSEQLFKYCFFRAGIGFSPKTFMSLVPVYVKERLKSYVDTFRVLPSSTPEIVLDQFIRNNWDNNRLVPRKKNIVMRRLENGNFEVYKESDVKELQKTQYFKMKVDNVDKLYQQVLLKDDSIEYKEVSPLGSNKDYLEISVDGIDKPIEIPSTSLEDNKKSEISPSTDGEAKSDESTLSKQEQIDLLHQIYMTKGKTFADAEKTIQNYKAMDNEFKKAIESQVKKFMKSRLETLGIKFDEKTIEEEYKKLC